MTNVDSSLLRVLQCFRSTDTVGFTELAEKLGFETDLAGYYLRRLQRRGLVTKVERGSYQITPLGKSMVAHGAQLSSLALMPRTSVMVIAQTKVEYVLMERRTQPFIGRVEWPTSPLRLGEPLEVAAKHTAELRLGLSNVQPKFHGFFRRIDSHQGTIFDDKLFAIHKLQLTQDVTTQLPAENEIGRLLLTLAIDIAQLEHRARSLLDILTFTQSDKPYAEQQYELTQSDFYS
ncbi:MAG TPA: hypothetical protein VLE99_02930 [Candidatus Saccharimonadales bacterium]|nr:hypothetical protein [Candidatus Saccharimonadales bacterium]